MHLTLRAAALSALALTTALTGVLASPAAAQERRAMTAADVVTLNRLAAPTVSADGRWAAYQLTTTDAATLARNTGLYLLDLRAADAAPLRIADLPDASENSPAFTPDGRRLYFISGKSGRDQLWFVELAATGTGTASTMTTTMTMTAPVQASDVPAAVAGFRLAPNGQRVLVWGDAADGSPTLGPRTPASPSLNRPGPGSARVYDRMFVRHWDTWEEQDSHNRAFVFALGSDGRVSGDAVPVRAEANGDVPSNPFGGADELAWSADSQTVYFAMRVDDRNEPTSTNLDIYMANVGQGPAVNLTDSNDATDTLPSPSPDGRTLAYVAMARPGYEADRQVLMLRDLRAGTTRALTQNWDRSIDSIAWAPDSRSIVVTAQDTLEHPAFRINVRSGAVERLTDRGTVGDVSTLARGGILYSINSIASPSDLVIRNGDGTTRALTSVNAAQLGALAPVNYEQFSFRGANGDLVYGQVVAPMGATGRLPTVLMIHGGPQGSFGDSWSNRWNPALWASQGYAVVTIDFHGSTGYGQAFTDSINRNWGGWPLEDLRLGFAAAAASNAQVDTSNACAAGASYGGYMVNWIAGQWPDGFKCLIQHDGVFDARAMAYETEELWFDEWEHGGPYFQVPQDYERWNPVNHVAQWRTPMLVVTGERDYRIPYTQGIASFTALQRRNIPSRLVVFPDENHWVLRAANSLQWHGEVFGWLNQWLRTPAAASAAATPVAPAPEPTP